MLKNQKKNNYRAAGFIAHIIKDLIQKKSIVGIDNLNLYYDKIKIR